MKLRGGAEKGWNWTGGGEKGGTVDLPNQISRRMEFRGLVGGIQRIYLRKKANTCASHGRMTKL
jgi:hypothetical protein